MLPSNNVEMLKYFYFCRDRVGVEEEEEEVEDAEEEDETAAVVRVSAIVNLSFYVTCLYHDVHSPLLSYS